MKLSELKKLIKEIASESDLDFEIEQYFQNQKELETKRKAIENQLTELSAIEKSLKVRVKKIQSYMEDNKIDERKVNNWVAKLKEVAKYKKIQPDYKDLWLEALKKVNEVTRRVMEKLELAQVETKKAATQIELELMEEGIMDILKGMWNKLTSLFSTFKEYNQIASKLPKLS